MIKRILLTLSLLIVIVASFAMPVLADDEKSTGLTAGDKIQVDKGTSITYLGANPDGTRNWETTFSGPEYLDDLKTPIHCSWLYDAVTNTFTSDANLYTATVKETAVTVEYNGSKMSWDPLVFVGTKAQSPTYASLCIQDPINENYYGNTLQWWYGDIYRNLRIIEGMLIEYYTIDSMPTDFVRIIPNTVRDADFTYSRDIAIWDDEDNPVDFKIDDAGAITLTVNAMKEAIFPITIDPDTSFTTSASDGYLTYSDASWDTARNSAAAENSNDAGDTLVIYNNTSYMVYRSYVYFDSAAIPDGAVVTDARLYLRTAGSDPDNDNVRVFIVSGMATYPHDPLVVGDYDYNQYAFGTNYGYGDYTDNDLGAAGYHLINANAGTATLASIINITGYTKLCLIERRDKENELPTGGNSDVNFYSYEKGVGYRPYLEIDYVTDEPTMTTDAASNVGNTTARINSTVVDDQDDDVTIRFGWGLTSEATIDAYDDHDTVAGTFNTGEHPYLDIGSLAANTLYYFRVEGTNAKGATLGAEDDFTTTNAVTDVGSLSAYPEATYVSLTWETASGASQYMLRYKIGSYPADETDGTQVYFGASTSTTHSGLTIGQTYYYAVWGESGGTYSTGSATAMATTSAADTAGEGLPTPGTPVRWMAAPDYTNMANLLILYDAVNGTADTLDMPRETLWLMLAMLFSVGFGIAIYIVTKFKMLPAMIAMIIAMSFGWTIKLIPFWIPLMALIILVAVKVGHKEVEY